MRSYNWRFPLVRLICASFVAFCLDFLRTTSPDVPLGQAPIICNGDLREHVLVFAQLVGAAISVEILSLAVWFLNEKRRVRSAQSGMRDLKKYNLSGGELLGLESSLYSLAFAIGLIVFSGRVIGIPNPCPPMNLNPFSWRHLMGALVAMYGVMGAINYLMERVDRSSNKMPI
jgi:hypothetical protein